MPPLISVAMVTGAGQGGWMPHVCLAVVVMEYKRKTEPSSGLAIGCPFIRMCNPPMTDTSKVWSSTWISILCLLFIVNVYDSLRLPSYTYFLLLLFPLGWIGFDEFDWTLLFVVLILLLLIGGWPILLCRFNKIIIKRSSSLGPWWKRDRRKKDEPVA